MEETQLYEKLEALRVQLHKIVDDRIDELFQRIENGESLEDPMWEHALTIPTAVFKGTKVVSVTFPDGRERTVKTWRSAVETILWDCNADPLMHKQLLNLTDRVNGNHRPLLSSHPERMDVPIQVADGIYFEGKLDTEQLLRVLVEKVLKPVGYDCSAVTVRHRAQMPTEGMESTQREIQNDGMAMQM